MPPAHTLRPYQAEAVDAITSALYDGGTGQLHAACGSGKTFIAQQTAARLTPHGTVAFLVPSLALIAQIIDHYRGTDTPRPTLAVCYDDTVIDAPAHLGDLHATITTSPQDIAAWLRDTPASAPRLIACTYASAARLAAGLREHGRPLDFLILDEAHHLAGLPEPAKQKLVTDPSWMPARRRLYMTATPRIDAELAERRGFLSMDDEALFGPVLYSYPFSRAIAEEHLEDYRVFVVGIPDPRVVALANDERRLYADTAGAPELRTVIAQAALIRAREQFGVQRTIAFCNSIEASREFARTLRGTADRMARDEPLYAGHVDGEMEQAVRSGIIGHLRTPPAGGWSVVSNAKCLGEGVDVPAVDSVLFTHPKSSAVDIVQAVGRALRKHPGTSGRSTIIVPIVLPAQDGEIGDLDPGQYETLWQVLRALRAHDEPFGASLDWARATGEDGPAELPDKITFSLPPGTSELVLNQLNLLAVRQTTSQWWDGYRAAAAYHAEHGHLDVPMRHRSDPGHALGAWIVKQRMARRRGWLAADKVAALDKLGITWDPHDGRFQATLAACAAYRAEHGHLDVPSGYVTPDGVRLGAWVCAQRARRGKGTLSAERAAELDALGMIWDGRQHSNDEFIAHAAAYVEEHGDLLAPNGYRSPDGFLLRSRLDMARVNYKRGTIDPDLARRLEGLGIVWNLAKDHDDLLISEARAYIAEHGDLDVKQLYVSPRGYTLGARLRAARERNRRGVISSELKAALDELGMSWAPRSESAGLAVPAARRDLTDEEVRRLRSASVEDLPAVARELREGGAQQRAMARVLGVSDSQMVRIVRR